MPGRERTPRVAPFRSQTQRQPAPGGDTDVACGTHDTIRQLEKPSAGSGIGEAQDGDRQRRPGIGAEDRSTQVVDPVVGARIHVVAHPALLLGQACDQATQCRAEVFVGVLGASSYVFAQATWTQSLPDWL